MDKIILQEALNKLKTLDEAESNKLSKVEIENFYKNLPDYVKLAKDYLDFMDVDGNGIFAVCFAVIGKNYLDVCNGEPLFYGLDSDDYKMKVDNYCKLHNINQNDVIFKTVYNK